MGGFAIGTTEFVTMGVLPQVADGVDVSIPEAGHVISAYALGVVVGAPLLAFFGARLPRRGLLLALMAAYALFNAASALRAAYGALMVARFLDGLPHGAYFGVASLVAASMAAPERRGRAVALVLMGLPVANVRRRPGRDLAGPDPRLAGVVLGRDRLSRTDGRARRGLRAVVPGQPRGDRTPRAAALRQPQVWFAVVAGAIGFGGMFALFSYIAPTVTKVGGLADAAVPRLPARLGWAWCSATGWRAALAGLVAVRLADRRAGRAGVLAALVGCAPHGWARCPPCSW